MVTVQLRLGTPNVRGRGGTQLSVSVGSLPGEIVFPLDDFALTSLYVGGKAGAALWAVAAETAWSLCGGTILDPESWKRAETLAATILTKRFRPSTSGSKFATTATRRDDDWIVELNVTGIATRVKEIEPYVQRPMVEGWSQRVTHFNHWSVGDRVHVPGGLDGEIIDLTSHRLGGGMVLHIRQADGELIRRRRSEALLASQRPVAVTRNGDAHTLAIEVLPLVEDANGLPGASRLRITHHGCTCSAPP